MGPYRRRHWDRFEMQHIFHDTLSNHAAHIPWHPLKPYLLLPTKSQLLDLEARFLIGDHRWYSNGSTCVHIPKTLTESLQADRGRNVLLAGPSVLQVSKDLHQPDAVYPSFQLRILAGQGLHSFAFSLYRFFISQLWASPWKLRPLRFGEYQISFVPKYSWSMPYAHRSLSSRQSRKKRFLRRDAPSRK